MFHFHKKKTEIAFRTTQYVIFVHVITISAEVVVRYFGTHNEQSRGLLIQLEKDCLSVPCSCHEDKISLTKLSNIKIGYFGLRIVFSKEWLTPGNFNCGMTMGLNAGVSGASAT